MQSQFTIIRGPAWYADKAELGIIMKVYAIIHKMVIENKQDSYDLAYDCDHVEDRPWTLMFDDTNIHGM